MSRPVVIIDPLSSGIELAPAFNARGISAIAVTLKSLCWNGFGAKVQFSDFAEIIPDQENIIEVLKTYNPIAIIPGTEEAVILSEKITNILTPQFSNDSKKFVNRLHKALMQQCLKEAGISVVNTLNASSENEVAVWLHENKMINAPLVLKPPASAGSDKVFHVPAKGNWKLAFNRVLAEPSSITGKLSKTVVVQEEAIGTEYAIGTVSANGRHYLSHLIKYNKIASCDRKTIYDHVEFIAYNKEEHGVLLDYTQKALDALGIRWGAAHSEVMLTQQGPRLIEASARMCGGPVVGFSREATGSSQADRLVELYADGDILTKSYTFKKSVVPVFLKAHAEGVIYNLEAFEAIFKLPTFFKKYIWVKNGDFVRQTVDYLTAIGIIGLAGEREQIFLDYKKIRSMESRLVIKKI